jgi:hypothetical protein
MGLPRLSSAISSISPLNIVRCAQVLFALLTLALISSVAAAFNANQTHISSPSQINFLIWCAVFTMLVVVPYTTLAPRYYPRLASAYVMLGAELTTALFWFAGFIATANLIRTAHTCIGVECGSAIAGTIFASFEL